MELFSEESQYADRAREVVATGEKGVWKLKAASSQIDSLIKEIEESAAATKTAVSTDLAGRGSSLTKLKEYRTKFRAILKTVLVQFPEPVKPAEE